MKKRMSKREAAFWKQYSGDPSTGTLRPSPAAIDRVFDELGKQLSGRRWPGLNEEIGAAELARFWGVSRYTAWRRMCVIERDHPGVIFRAQGRGGVHLRTTWTAISPFIGKRPEDRLTREVERLRDELTAEKQQKDQLVREFSEFRRSMDRELDRVTNDLNLRSKK